MRLAFRIIGAVLGLMGLVFGLQGIGVLGGSPMTGQGFWAGAGLVLFVTGVSLAYFGMRPQQDNTVTRR